MRKAIITACIGKDESYIEIWLASIRACNFDGDVIVITERDTKLRQSAGRSYQIVKFDIDLKRTNPAVIRCRCMYEILKNVTHKYDMVICTDGKDVAMQRDPFPLLSDELHQTGSSIAIGVEGVLLKHEPWVNGIFAKHFSDVDVADILETECLNVGFIGGSPTWVRDYYLNCYMWTKHSLNVRGAEQAATDIFLNRSPWREVTLKTATVVFNVACSPGSISAIKQYTGHAVTERGGIVTNAATGHVYPLLHMYDRHDSMKRAVSKRYTTK